MNKSLDESSIKGPEKIKEDAKKMTAGLIEILKPYKHVYKTNEEWFDHLKSDEFKTAFNKKMSEVLGVQNE